MTIMTYNYKIYQLDPHNPEQLKKMYRDYKYVVEKFGGVNINEYKMTYSGILQIDIRDNIQLLEHIFEKFNVHHPEDFHGHSLSVSDIVEIDNKKYFCDAFGWKEL